jgi:hypothetical protein
MAVEKVVLCINTGFNMFLNPNFVEHFIDVPEKPKKVRAVKSQTKIKTNK